MTRSNPAPKFTNERNERAVAIKVLANDCGRRELEIMKRITNMASLSAGADYVVQLLDDFEWTGPNGIHLFLVLELTGQDVYSLFEGYTDDSKVRVPLSKSIARQILRGLDFLQTCGVIHNGDPRTWKN
jgi:serine/threonine-protein kinase SRPK3